MTRISTSAANQSALMDLMRAQRNVFEAQQQLTTGKRAQDLKGVGYQAETLTATRAAVERAKAYEEAAVRTSARLEAQNVALERIAGAAVDLRAALTSKEGDYVMHQVRDAFQNVAAALNTNHAGTYLFGGTRSDMPPVTVSTVNDLLPLADASDAFSNNERKPQVQLDQNLTVEVGMLADDVGGDLMAAFKRIAEYNAGADGPFSKPLNATQENYLVGELQTVIGVLDDLHAKVGENGSVQARVENLQQSHSDRQDFLQQMLGKMEDVDMAEAASRFQQAQTAVEVSARTFSALTQVSLLPFLR